MVLDDELTEQEKIRIHLSAKNAEARRKQKTETIIIEVNECKVHGKMNCPECLVLMLKDLQKIENNAEGSV